MRAPGGEAARRRTPPWRRTRPALRRQHPALRRLLSAGLIVVAAGVTVHGLAPAPVRVVPVVVAAHDLAAGHRLRADDVAIARWLPGTGPTDTVTDPSLVVGRVTAGALPKSGAITRESLLGPGLLTGQPPDLTAVPVRLADPAIGALVHRGDTVDVIAAATSSAVVSGVVVLADPAPGAADGAPLGSSLADGGSIAAGSGGGLSVIVGVPLWDAERLAHAQSVSPLTLALQP